MNEIFSVKDQVVVITGGTGVLGRCIGEYLATQGAKVVLMGRRKDEGDEIVAGITAKGGRGNVSRHRRYGPEGCRGQLQGDSC